MKLLPVGATGAGITGSVGATGAGITGSVGTRALPLQPGLTVCQRKECRPEHRPVERMQGVHRHDNRALRDLAKV